MRSIYLYSEDETLIKEQFDTDGDGEIDTEYEYDTDGNLSSHLGLSTALNGEELEAGQVLQFEMVQNGESITATATVDDSGKATVD